MKKRISKKLVMAMAVMALFSTTIVYGATAYQYTYEMNVAATMYTPTVTKTTTTSYAEVSQIVTNATMEYTVVNNMHVAKSNTIHITGIDTINIPYYSGVTKGDVIGIKIYNDPADNQGRVRTITMRWTP